MKRLMGAAALLAAASGMAWSAAPAADRVMVDVSVFAQLPPIEAPQLSPDGKAYAAKVAIKGQQSDGSYLLGDVTVR